MKSSIIINLALRELEIRWSYRERNSVGYYLLKSPGLEHITNSLDQTADAGPSFDAAAAAAGKQRRLTKKKAKN